MIFDYQQVVMLGGIISFPDYLYATNPLSPNQVGETIMLGGTTADSSTSVGGTADQQDW